MRLRSNLMVAMGAIALAGYMEADAASRVGGWQVHGVWAKPEQEMIRNDWVVLILGLVGALASQSALANSSTCALLLTGLAGAMLIGRKARSRVIERVPI